METVYIVSAVRTPIGSFMGALAGLRSVDLGITALKEALIRGKIPDGSVDELILGNVLQAGTGMNVSRQVAIGSGLGSNVPTFTINKVCGSGLKSVALAAQSIQAGQNGVVVAGGVESMSNAPYLLPKGRTGYRMGHGEILDSMILDGLTDVFNSYHMGVTAENVAEKYSIGRAEQDEFSVASQTKAVAAIVAGRFKDEIVPVPIPQRKGDPILFDTDEYPKKGTTLEALAKLKPAFKKDGTVTAGNASGINDGAAIVIVASETAVKKYDLKPLARIVGYATGCVDPSVMGLGPVPAVQKLLAKTGMKMTEIDLFELNEAFAVQSIAVARELKPDPAKVNVNGGAIALGHPLGASGARILTTLIYNLRHENKTLGCASLCIGGGMGIAMMIEKV